MLALVHAAAVRNVWQFYLLRFLLGLAEGGACAPCMLSCSANVVQFSAVAAAGMSACCQRQNWLLLVGKLYRCHALELDYAALLRKHALQGHALDDVGF